MQNPGDERSRYVASFQSLGKLKFGERFVTTCCNSQWYLHDLHHMYLLTPSRLALVDDWASRELTITDAWRVLLDRIGTPRSKYGPEPDYPCEAILHGGTPVNHCVVSLRTLPPGLALSAGPDPERDFYYLDEISSLAESPDALSLDIRNALMELRDIERCPQTLVVENGTGRRVIVDSSSNFSPIAQEPADPFHLADDTRGPTPVRPIPPRETTVIADPF